MLFTLTLMLSSANPYKRGAGNCIMFIVLVLPLVISQTHSFESQKLFNFPSKFPFYSSYCMSVFFLLRLILNKIQEKKFQVFTFVSLNSRKCVIFFQSSYFPQTRGMRTVYFFFHYFIFFTFFSTSTDYEGINTFC